MEEDGSLWSFVSVNGAHYILNRDFCSFICKTNNSLLTQEVIMLDRFWNTTCRLSSSYRVIREVITMVTFNSIYGMNILVFSYSWCTCVWNVEETLRTKPSIYRSRMHCNLCIFWFQNYKNNYFRFFSERVTSLVHVCVLHA